MALGFLRPAAGGRVSAALRFRQSQRVSFSSLSSEVLPPSIPAPGPARAPRDVPAAAERRVEGMFYDRAVTLSRRQKTVFARAEDEPSLPPAPEGGFLYGLTEADMAGRNAMVRRALSTATASAEDARAFERAGLLRRFETAHLDTGSSRVQVAALTARIQRLSGHLAQFKKDTHSKRSLLILASRRRRVLEYMMRRDFSNYRLVLKELGLRPLAVFNSPHQPKVRKETHAQIIERNGRLKNRSSRGALGH